MERERLERIKRSHSRSHSDPCRDGRNGIKKRTETERRLGAETEGRKRCRSRWRGITERKKENKKKKEETN